MTFMTTIIILAIFYGGGYTIQQNHLCDDVNRKSYLTREECEVKRS